MLAVAGVAALEVHITTVVARVQVVVVERTTTVCIQLLICLVLKALRLVLEVLRVTVVDLGMVLLEVMAVIPRLALQQNS